MLAGQYAVRSFLLSVAAALTALRKSKAPHSARSAGERKRESRSRHASPIRASASKRKDRELIQTQASGSRAAPRVPREAAFGQPRVVRRVTAVVTVKEEDESEVDVDALPDDESVASGSVYEPGSSSAPTPRRRRPSAVSFAKSKRAAREGEGEEGEEQNEEEGEDEDELLLSSKVS